MPLQQLDRQDFLDNYFDYRPGEHLSLIMPTQRGKTHMAYQLLQSALRQNPQLRVVSFMPKPNSPATARWAEALNLREIPEWPPRKKLFQSDPAGYLLWPKHRRDLKTLENRQQIAEKFREAMKDLYWEGDVILLADDIFVLAVLMGLNPDCEEWWTAGSEGGAGLWGPNQKPSGSVGSGSVSSFSYNAPLHMLLGKDSDERNIQRFSEIGGGIDPRRIADIVRNLRLFQIGGKSISEQLYIDKRNQRMALIGP